MKGGDPFFTIPIVFCTAAPFSLYIIEMSEKTGQREDIYH